MSFSFTNFSSPTNTSGNESDDTRKPTERQYAFYKDLCTQRNVEAKDIAEFASYDELSDEIKKIRAYFPASEKQIELIKAKIENLNKMDVNITMPDTSALTGGREGSASKLIESLLKMEKQYKDKMPPSEKQLQYMVNMFLCPDVGFEEYEINKKIALENNKWRYMNPNEFAEEIKSKMNGKEASYFIDKNKEAFNQWRSTRIRPEQQRYIRVLEDRFIGKEDYTIEWVVNNKGEMEMKKTYNTTEDTSKIWRLTEMQLMQFSVKDASKYIEILTSELARKEKSTTLEPENSREDKKEDNELKALETVIYYLETVVGHELFEFHEKISSLLTDGFDSTEINQIKNDIREFMLEIIKQDYIDLAGLVELCKDSITAQRILLGIA